MKALTIQQPWAWYIFNTNASVLWQSWPGKPRIRGYFLIHAGMSWDLDAEEWMIEQDLPVPGNLPSAKLLGYARLGYITGAPQGEHFHRSGFAFHLTDIQQFRQPTVAVGRRGFWPVPAHILKNLRIPHHVSRSPL